MAQRLKSLPGMQETRVRSLGWEDPLEKEMATHSSTLAWRIPRREEPRRLQSDRIELLHFHFLSKSLQMVTAAMKLKDTPWKKSYDQPK